MRFSRTPLLVRALFFFVIALPLATPVNFVVIQPGEGAPLFPKVLQLTQGFEEKIETYKPNGQMFLLSIWVSKFKSKFESETSRSVGQFQRFQDSFRQDLPAEEELPSEDSPSQNDGASSPEKL